MQEDKAPRGPLASFDVPRLRTRYAVVPLGVVILGSMLALGGAPTASVMPLAALAALALALSGVDARVVRRDPALWLLAVLVAVSALQLVPLPPFLLRLLDAGSEEISRRAWWAWRIDRASSWRALHRDPGTGAVDFVYLLGLASCYVAATHVARRDGLDRLVELCAWSALGVSFLGLAHLGTDQDLLYGFYRPHHAAPPVLSPLLNSNHLAALTGAGAILWLGRAVGTRRAVDRVLSSACSVLCGVVCALSLSRGGVAAAAGGVLVFLALNSRTDGEDRTPRKRPALETWLGAGLGALVFAGGAWMSSSQLAAEYATGDSSKLQVYRRALGLLRGQELLGYGSGSVPVASATSGRLDADFTFLRVESLPIDLALSVGVFATLAVAVLGARALRRWFPPAYAEPQALAVWAALVSLIAHDLVDFSLYLGAVGYVAATLAGVLSGWVIRDWRRPLSSSPRSRRGVGAAALAAVLVVGWLARGASLEDDRDAADRGLRASPTYFNTAAARASVARHPGDAYLQLVMGSYATSLGSPMALRFVARAMELSPTWAQPHLLLARVLAAGNRRGQALLEIREVLSRSAQLPGQTSHAALRLQPPPTPEELDRVAPRNRAGLDFLNGVAVFQGDAPYTASVDRVILARDPRYQPALLRRAAGARALGEHADAARWCEQIERAEPANAVGAACRADTLVAQGRDDEAFAVLERALPRVTDRYPLHALRARILARRSDMAGMRREAASMQETAGADLQRLVAAHALLGELEFLAGNDRAAYTAFEMAQSLTVPDHPYAIQMASIARRLGDRQALALHCAVLLEQAPPPPGAQVVCDPGAVRRAAGDAGP